MTRAELRRLQAWAKLRCEGSFRPVPRTGRDHWRRRKARREAFRESYRELRVKRSRKLFRRWLRSLGPPGHTHRRYS